MNVYTYFDQLPGFDKFAQLQQIEVWKTSWESYGWRPVILNNNFLKRYENYDNLSNILSKLPTVNSQKYELACYLRWAVLQTVGGGLLTDYDCVNIGYTPSEHNEIIKNNDIVHFSPHCTPMTYANTDGCKNIIKNFSNYKIQDDDLYNGLPHTSDMLILTKSKLGIKHLICHDADQINSDTKIIHCASRCATAVGISPNGRSEMMKKVFLQSANTISDTDLMKEIITVDKNFIDLAVVGGSLGREDTQGVWHNIISSYINNVKILDVGAGLGESKNRMNIRGINVTTQDPGPGLPVDLSCTIDQIPDKSFDIVTAFDVIEHVTDMKLFVKHMRRIAKKYIVLTTPNFLVTCNTHVYHHREMTPSELIALVGGPTAYHYGWCMFPDSRGIQPVDFNGMKNALDAYNSCVVAKSDV